MMFQVERRVSERAGRRTDVESVVGVGVACLGLAIWIMRREADVSAVRFVEVKAGRLESAALHGRF